MVAYKELDQEKKMELTKQHPPGLAGVEQSEEVLEWVWNNFSAVAGDHPSFECWRKRHNLVIIIC